MPSKRSEEEKRFSRDFIANADDGSLLAVVDRLGGRLYQVRLGGGMLIPCFDITLVPQAKREKRHCTIS